MHLTIIFLVLCSCRIISSVLVKDGSSANITRGLFDRAINPTYGLDGSCALYPQALPIVNDWYETVQVTARRVDLGPGDPDFQYALKFLFGIEDDDQLYNFAQLEGDATAYAFIKCKG